MHHLLSVIYLQFIDILNITTHMYYTYSYLYIQIYIEKSGLISTKLCKILLTTVALSMALTPFLAESGAKIAKKIEENMGLTHYLINENEGSFVRAKNNRNDNDSNNIDVDVDDSKSKNKSSNIKNNSSINNNINNNAKQSESKSNSYDDFVFICGYGKVGQIICEMLDRKFIPYIVIENSPQKAIDARNKGLPVYFGEL